MIAPSTLEAFRNWAIEMCSSDVLHSWQQLLSIEVSLATYKALASRWPFSNNSLSKKHSRVSRRQEKANK